MSFWKPGNKEQRQHSFTALRERVRIGRERTTLLICMGISLLFWFFVKMSKPYETSRELSLQYVLPPAMEFIESPPAKAKATISGTGIDLLLNAIFKRNTNVIFQLNEISGASISKDFIIRKIEEAISIEVADVAPPFISIEMDSSASRIVPVKLVSKLGFVKDFFQTGNVLLKPDSVMVTGAPEILAQIPSIPTKPLDLANIRQPVQRDLELETSGEGLFKVFPTKVEVLIPVEQYIEKTFEIPLEAKGRNGNLRLIPSSATLKCSIPLSKYDATTSNDFVLEVDISNLQINAGQNTVPVSLLKAPDWVKSVQFSPKLVEYYIVQ